MALCIESSRYLSRREGVSAHPEGVAVRLQDAESLVVDSTRRVANCMRLWPELGLTLSSRTRITTVDAIPHGEWDSINRYHYRDGTSAVTFPSWADIDPSTSEGASMDMMMRGSTA